MHFIIQLHHSSLGSFLWGFVFFYYARFVSGISLMIIFNHLMASYCFCVSVETSGCGMGKKNCKTESLISGYGSSEASGRMRESSTHTCAMIPWTDFFYWASIRQGNMRPQILSQPSQTIAFFIGRPDFASFNRSPEWVSKASKKSLPSSRVIAVN